MRWVVLLVVLSLLPLSGCGRQTDLDANGDMEAPVDMDAETNPLFDLDAEELAAIVRDDSWHMRLAAGATLPQRDDIPLEKRVELLVQALEREIEDPGQGRTPLGAWLPAEEHTRMHLVAIMAELDPEAVPALRQATSAASPEAHDYLVVALAYLGDREAATHVRDLLTDSSNPWLRSEAASALGVVDGEKAIPLLKAALQDPYVTTVSDCLGEFRIFPVRESAANVLRDLGMTVEMRDDDTFGVRE